MSNPTVILDEGAKENGLAVMLSDLLTQNMEQHPEKVRCFNKLKTVVAISAPDVGVSLTLFFNRGSCVLYDGIVGQPALHIEAESDSILKLSQLSLRFGLPYPFDEVGREVARKTAQGKVKIHGLLLHPLALVRITKLLSVA